VLYHDSETETFWSQMTGEALVGPLTGKRLAWIPSVVATWGTWKRRHPETTVLKAPLVAREYEAVNLHYARYRRDRSPVFPTGPAKPDRRYPPMTTVTILLFAEKARCYPHPLLAEGETRDGDLRLVREGLSVRAFDRSDAEIPTMQSYWFAWTAFHAGGFVFEKREG